MQLDRGIIEKVPLHEIDTTNTVHYLPHHPVVKSSSVTTKIRVVYDASSKLRKHDVSLNECMFRFRGPVMLPDMCQLLMRFRTYETVVISDIEKAFLQVALQTIERDVTRFFWYDSDKPDVVSNNIAVYRFCRVVFGIISSPFLLSATIQHHLSSQNTSFAATLMKDIYVDNVISGVDGEDNAIPYYDNVKSLFAKAGMNLQEFCSNSTKLMNHIPERDRVKNTDVNVLGMKWDSQNDDTIRICFPKWHMNRDVCTKRSVLQSIASVFDPLGLFQPVLFEAKLFLQRLWKLSLPWDTSLSTELKNEWTDIIDSISGLFKFRIPRYIGNVTEISDLLVFSDASIKGYGAVIYLRCKTDSGVRISNLLFAKSRLTPIPKELKSGKTTSCQITLPRLELLGATIATTAAVFCRKAFSFPRLQIHFFIDSECVLQWIRSKHVLKRFVARRVEKIRAVENCTFHYVNTADNPADYLTRGKTAPELIDEAKWWHGPSWLTKDESGWPETRLQSTSDEFLREIAYDEKPTTIYHTLAVTEPQTKDHVQLTAEGLIGIDLDRISSFRRLLRITVICLKFLRLRIWDRLPDGIRQDSNMKCMFTALSDDVAVMAQDIDVATELWVRHIQSQVYHDIHTNACSKPKNAIVNQLRLRVDDKGLIRTYSRFANADLPEDSKYPLLLPKDNRLSQLIVQDIHRNLKHSGVSHTLSEVRKRYWIPQGRSFVKKILKRCMVCRLLKTAVPFALPDMPPWPLERVSRSAPFQFTGLDYFGPVKLRINEKVEKMWACLFTCLATRAVHIEAVTDCTSAEFLSSLIRFVSRRGCPQRIISDNAAQFHLVKILGDRAWQRTPNDEALMSYSAHSGIEWKFIIELAPWQGGHYERLVGVVKSVLKTAIGRRLLSWTDFITLLTETEAIVNSRPITYIGDDVESLMRALRPVDFLTSRPTSIATDNANFPTRDLGDTGKRLANIWKQRERHLDNLWQHWYEEYLSSLRERSKVSHRNGRGFATRSPREGEVVLLWDKDLPRGSWRLAKVIRLISSSDGQIRAAEIKLGNGVQLRRTVNFLIPLEVDCELDDADSGIVQNSEQQGFGDISKAGGVVNSDEEDFHGFTPEEVQGGADAIQRLPSSGAGLPVVATGVRQK